MRKLILLSLFFVLVLISSVFALEVSLESPENDASMSENIDVDFICSVNEASNAINMTLSISGDWSHKKYDTTLEQEGYGLFANFLVNNFNPGTYSWSCSARSEDNTEYTSESRSLAITEVNTPPIIVPPGIPSPQTGGLSSWTLNLSDYMYDLEDIASLIWSVNYIDAFFCNVNINEQIATFLPVAGVSGSRDYTFILTDDEGLTDEQNVTVTLDQSSTPQTTCGDGTCDSDEDCGNCLDDCSIESNEICCSGEIFDGDCCSDSDCSSDEECDEHNCIEIDDDTDSSGEEQSEDDETSTGAIISSRSPFSSIIDMRAGNEKKFSVSPSISNVKVKWYLDDKELTTESDKNYYFKPDEVGRYEIKAVLGNNDDFFLWIVNVMGAKVKSWDEETTIGIEESVSEEGKVISITGYFVQGKDLVIKKWKASSILLGIIVLVIIILSVKKFRKKDDILSEFGKEGFFGKVRKKLRDWDNRRKLRKVYVNKKAPEVKSDEIEKHVEFHIDKTDDAEKK